MEKTFIFESDHFSSDGETCDQIEVTIEVWGREDESGWEDMTLHNTTTDQEVKIEAFPKGEVERIEKRADDIADESGPDAYQDYCEGEGDRAYDAWKDRQMEDGE